MGPGTTTVMKKRAARRRALERQSEKCVVAKKINKVLDQNEFLDCEHALEVIKIELCDMPESYAVRNIIERILDI